VVTGGCELRVPIPKSRLPVDDRDPLSNAMNLGQQDWTDGQMKRPRYGNISLSRRN